MFLYFINNLQKVPLKNQNIQQKENSTRALSSGGVPCTNEKTR